MSYKARLYLSIPRDLYAKIGSQEKTAELVKNGLLSLRATCLEREVADLDEKIQATKKHNAELPNETKKLERLLEEAITDRKTLEDLLTRRTR
jgi:uncharacterized protein involved in exopolysaccharide biosynthesis